jgi:hypothetical protein
VLCAVVGDLQPQWRQRSQFFTHGVDGVHAGSTFLKGSTRTPAKTPSLT